MKTKYGAGISVELEKPLGITFVSDAAGPSVGEIGSDGSAAECDKITSGMTLVALNGEGISDLNFDAVIEKLVAAESPVRLTMVASMAAAAAPPAPAAPLPPAPRPPRFETQQQQVDAAFDKNFGSEEGFSKLATKVQKTVFNWNTWKNPLWGGSLAFAVGFPLLIVVLAGDRL